MEGTSDVTGLPLAGFTDIEEHGTSTHEGVGLPRADVAPVAILVLPLPPAHTTSRRPSIPLGRRTLSLCGIYPLGYPL